MTTIIIITHCVAGAESVLEQSSTKLNTSERTAEQQKLKIEALNDKIHQLTSQVRLTIALVNYLPKGFYFSAILTAYSY